MKAIIMYALMVLPAPLAAARDKHIAIWDEVDSHILSPSMLKAYLGDLRYVTDPDLPEMSGFGLYSQNAFLKGVFVLRSSGKTIETEFAVRDKEISSRVKSGDFETYKTQTDKEISSRVTSSDFETYKTQTDKEISSRVKSGEVISEINQTAGAVKILAKCISLEGLITANANVFILPNGSIMAKNATISGQISATSGVFRNVIVNGSIRNSFQNGNYAIGSSGPITISTYGVNNNNNIVIPGHGGPYVYTMFEVPFDKAENNGFRVTILNEDFGGDSATGVIRANAPNGKYFYENGIAWDSLQIGAHEGIDMIGFGEGDNFNGWIVIRRFGSKTTPSHLMYHRDTVVDMPGVLCAGRVIANNGNISSQWGCKPCRGVKHNGEVGKYKLIHEIKHLDYYVTANVASNGFVGSVVVLEKTTTYVVLGVGGLDGGFWDNDFDFMLCGKN